MKNPSWIIWIGWLAGLMMASAVVTTSAFQTFQTKDAAKEDKTIMVEWLVRVEGKLDQDLRERKR